MARFPRFDMRTLLSALVLVPAFALAAGEPKRPAAREILHTQCLLHAADPKNPWALAHGLTGIGKNHAARDGRRAADVIIGDFLQKNPSEQGSPYAFAKFSADRTPIEPHPNLLLKSMVEARIPDSTSFKTPWGEKVTLGELVKSVQLGFAHVPMSEGYWLNTGWTLDLLGARLTPKNARFKNRAGEEIDFNKVMDDALAYLELAQAPIAEGMDKGLAEVPKRKQGIYAHSCGGLHLVQAINAWARFPEVKKRWGKRLDRQIDVLFYRLGSEQRQYDAALAQAPQYKLQLLTQMLKFYGHFLETTGRLKAENGFKPTVAQKRSIEHAKALLDHATTELQVMGAFETMEQIKKSHPQVFLDLIGDACHAAHGLSYWK